MEIKPFCCPVCNGSGVVSRPPNITGDQQTWTGSGTCSYVCHACNGSGVVWGPPPQTTLPGPTLLNEVPDNAGDSGFIKLKVKTI